MKKKIAALAAGICAASLIFTGCSSEISNDYVTITKYKNVEVDKVDTTEVTDDDVESQINSILQANATTTEVTDRAAQEGDTVTIDYVGKKDGVAFDGGTATGAQLTLGSGSYIDGFEDGVVGHKIGDTFDLDLTFPENYGQSDLAGQAVVFTVTLQGISESNVPELNDEFVQEVSEKSKTVKEYKKEIKDQLTESNTTDYDTQLQDEAWNAVLDKAEVKKYPDGDVEDIENQIKEQYQNAADSYGMEFADFLAQYYSMTEDDFNDQVTDAAKETVKQRLVAQAIADKEKLTPSKKELNKEYKKLAEQYGYADVDALKEIASEDTLKNIVITNKVKEFLADNCIQVKSDKSSDSSSDSSSK